MSEFASSVRFIAKQGKSEELLLRLSAFTLPAGALNHVVVQTGPHSFLTFLRWRKEDDLVAARPEMIAFLDTVRDLLDVISPTLGVTDPASGPVLLNLEAHS